MGNLDSKEINELANKYHKMMADINNAIIKSLQLATCTFDIRLPQNEPDRDLGKESETHVWKAGRTIPDPDDYCPCGSGKKFCECHGKSDIRSIRRTKRHH